MESLAKKIIAAEYAVAYGFELPQHLVEDLDYASLRETRKVLTVGYTQTLESVPDDKLPYAKTFRAGLQFIQRVKNPLVDYVVAALHLFGFKDDTYEVSIARTDKRVGPHVDNNIQCCLIFPLKNTEHGQTWFATPSMNLAASFAMQKDRVYLTNVSEYHGFHNPMSQEVWFLRAAFPKRTFGEVQKVLDMMLPRLELT